MKTPIRTICLGIAALALVLAGCTQAQPPDAGSAASASTSPSQPDRLTIAIAGMVTPASGLDYYMGLSKYIGRKVGEPVRLIHKADYAQVNQMLKNGTVDAAFVCSGPYVAGHDAFGVQLIAAPVVNGKPAYYSYIIAPKSSPATSLASMKGQVFAFADPQSNSGFIVPTYMLSTLGQQADTFFKETFFTYSHDNSIKAVATGKADGAAVDSLIYDYLSATDPTYTSRTRVVERSEQFAIPPVVARPGLDPVLAKKIQSVLLDANKDPEGRALLAKMNIQKFVVIGDSAYDSIRRMNERLKK